jgi:hypothetical protein
MAPLGEEICERAAPRRLSERWIDLYPNKGKQLGAFSYGGPGTHPFIMTSYTDDLFSMSTFGARAGPFAAFLLQLAYPACSSTPATPCLRPRSPPISTRPWCATIFCVPNPNGPFRSD